MEVLHSPSAEWQVEQEVINKDAVISQRIRGGNGHQIDRSQAVSSQAERKGKKWTTSADFQNDVVSI